MSIANNKNNHFPVIVENDNVKSKLNVNHEISLVDDINDILYEVTEELSISKVVEEDYNCEEDYQCITMIYYTII